MMRGLLFYLLGLGWVLSALGASLSLEEAAKLAPLPDTARAGGVLLGDLNGDGHADLVVSNPKRYGVYLFNAVEKKNVRWERGWTEVLREGDAGDGNALPLLVDDAGLSTNMELRAGALVDASGKVAVSAAELLRVPAPAPFPPGESLKQLVLRPGYTAELVAVEPLVQDPVHVDWDAEGRMWVVEMGDYPFAPNETTSDGKVGQGRVSDLQFGRIKVLEDADGDGVYERATTFLDKLLHPTGLAFWKGGIVVSAIPDVFYARDTNGDLVCDVVEPWYKGFTAGNPQHLVNGFAWGLDGWLHGANGDSGGEITNVQTGAVMKLGSYDFRFHPETREFRLETGRTQYGKWRDDYGNWFGNNNTTLAWHYHIPMAWMEVNADRLPPQVRTVLNPDTAVRTISPPVRRFNHAGATHVLTAACSPMPWRDGEEECLLVCEPANNLVRRDVLEYDSFPLKSSRHPMDAEAEFIASRDNWCRPVQMREGPDGALYLVDMYRLVLEHPEWIPAGISKGIDLRAGEDKGRIYRISGPHQSVTAPRKLLELRAAMASRIRWQRDTAQRLLLERRETEALGWLKELREDQKQPLGVRLQAAWTAALLDEGNRAALVHLIEAGHPKIRGAARVAAGSVEIHAEELAAWFPKGGKENQKPVELPVITRNNPDRAKVVQDYLKQVTGLTGNAERGQGIFARACAGCHRLGAQGIELGPDLATVAGKPTEQLLEALFDPNRAVEQRNISTQITRKDGSTLLGIISAETPGGVTLRLPGGLDAAIARTDIQSTKTLPISLMPDGLESVLTAQDVADLLEHLRQR